MKLDALQELANQLGRMDLSLDPGASRVALLIAKQLDFFVLDNEPSPVRADRLAALIADLPAEKLDELKTLVTSVRIPVEIDGELRAVDVPTAMRLGKVSQDAIDAARYRKLRSVYHDINSAVSIKATGTGLAPMTPESFDAWVDALPS